MLAQSSRGGRKEEKVNYVKNSLKNLCYSLYLLIHHGAKDSPKYFKFKISNKAIHGNNMDEKSNLENHKTLFLLNQRKQENDDYHNFLATFGYGKNKIK